MKKAGLAALLGLCAAAGPGRLWAHASEQAFVLLLPRKLYVASGTAAVALTLLLLALVPGPRLRRFFGSVPLGRLRAKALVPLTTTLSFVFLLWLLWRGVVGPHDPLANPLPLVVWTVWWVAIVVLQGMLGNVWRFLSPFACLRLGLAALRWRAPLRLPPAVGHAPGIALFILFATLVLASPAPDDPHRLAPIVAGYLGFTLLGLVLFGARWLVRGEAITMLMRCYGQIAVLGRSGRRLRLGVPGWQAARRGGPRMGAAVLMIVILACGSFDGLNETFLWAGWIGVNPLEYGGRSETVTANLVGLVLLNMMLFVVFGACVTVGLQFAGINGPRLATAFAALAPSLMPIALGYHIAHYLTAFLVNGQYVLEAVSDPLNTGADWLNLGPWYVSTGFLNHHASVQVIFLTQAGAVVVGHVLGVLLAHRIALSLFRDDRRAALSHAPLALLMLAYTWFGLWLLATARF